MISHYLTFDPLRRNSTGHQSCWPPQRADASRSLRQSIIELEFGGVKPRIGGLCGTEIMNAVIWRLKLSCLETARIWVGKQFHCLGRITLNDVSYRVSWAAEIFFRKDGTLARLPNLGFTVNCTWRSLDVKPCRIFHICIIT